MKKLLFTVAFSIQMSIVLFAQPASSDQLSVYNYKKLIGRSELKLNAIRDFTKRFGEVGNATWSRNVDRLRANFTLGDIKHMVDYDLKGRWVSTILVYDEDHLRSDLRKIVKSNYIDYKIVKVIEVIIGKSHVHFIKIENETSLLTLHIMNGEVSEIENYTKA
jgi:hypothetical protein